MPRRLGSQEIAAADTAGRECTTAFPAGLNNVDGIVDFAVAESATIDGIVVRAWYVAPEVLTRVDRR
jgi:hypothetical protein